MLFKVKVGGEEAMEVRAPYADAALRLFLEVHYEGASFRAMSHSEFVVKFGTGAMTHARVSRVAGAL